MTSSLFPGRLRLGLVASIAGALLVAGLALVAMHHLLVEVSLAQVRAAFDRLPAWRLGACAALSAASYALLTLYDLFALRIIGRKTPYRTAALASFTSYTLSHNLGLALLTGGSARYRIYSAAGLNGADIARVIAIASATFWIGVFALAGVALTFLPAADRIGAHERIVSPIR